MTQVVVKLAPNFEVRNGIWRSCSSCFVADLLVLWRVNFTWRKMNLTSIFLCRTRRCWIWLTMKATIDINVYSTEDSPVTSLFLRWQPLTQSRRYWSKTNLSDSQLTSLIHSWSETSHRRNFKTYFDFSSLTFGWNVSMTWVWEEVNI